MRVSEAIPLLPEPPTSESGRSTAAVGIRLAASHETGVGGEGARSMRAVEDQSAPIPEEITSER